MTAVVGILNKQAVAIAADSAVTINGARGRKIMNKANKVFALSKHHPVGIMIYNSASFMATPWETIIKVYRKNLGDNYFDTVKEYQEDFLTFLRGNDYYTTPDFQISALENLAINLVDTVINEVMNNNRALADNPTDETRAEFIRIFRLKLSELTASFTDPVCPEFIDYTFEEFEPYSQTIFDRIIQARFTSNGFILNSDLIRGIKNLVFTVLKSGEDTSNHTGLIFTGFGENEIYPQLIAINVSMVVHGKLRYSFNKNNSASISNLNDGAICPFAQTDVINTILSGVDPQLDNIYLNNFGTLFDKYNQQILSMIGDSNPELSAQIASLNTEVIVSEYDKMNEQIRVQNYIKPLMNAVSSLAKEDLAEMAESLIYLTYLKRRITFAEESVGGPVDVAIISKGDGFIWIKRKHYFKPEMNAHFFNNYYNQ